MSWVVSEDGLWYIRDVGKGLWAGMNFVIFARNFYPLNDAEAFCSTRFASALAKAGHSVHVVTAEYPGEGGGYKALVHPNLKITRVKAEKRECRVTSRLSALKTINLRHATVMDGDIHNLAAFVSATKEALSQYKDPILVTRALPMMSLYVGWHCRKHAAKWISHLSDPIPGTPYCSMLVRLQCAFMRFWLRRAFRYADATSVTCKRAIRWYQETLGAVVDESRCFVTTHIGDNKLESKGGKSNLRTDGKDVILHSGDMYFGRGELILDAVEELNKRGVSCTFVQDRSVNSVLAAKFRRYPHAMLMDGMRTAEESVALMESASAVFVADFSSSLDYSATFMSKFVYQAFGDKPMIVYANVDSEKHDYCVRYPEAGLFFAEQGNLKSLVGACRAALSCDKAHIDRTALRLWFSEDRIAKDFIRNLNHGDRPLYKPNRNLIY